MEGVLIDVAKGSASSILSAIVGRIGGEIVLAWGFKGDLKELKKKLKRVNYLLSGFESKFGSPESKNELLKDWLKKVAEVAYQAEDLVDEYAYHVLKRELALRDMNKTKVRFLCFYYLSSNNNPVVLRFRMAHHVKSLRESIAEIFVDAKDLGIKPVEAAGPSSLSLPANADSDDHDAQLQFQRQAVDYEKLFGREHDRANIMQLLREASNSNRRLSVIGVHGMAGLGKTTLCRSIFETSEMKEYFKERIWICVSHDFDTVRLLNDMAEQLDKNSSSMSNIDGITGRLHEKLQDKKFLLVLDDVWETFESAWEPLRCCLQTLSELKGNTILVTSRNKEVLAKLRSYDVDPCIYPLRVLGKEDSFSLFKQRVVDDLLDSTKAGLAEKMLEKCGGVPLAIKTLGDILRSRKQIQQWKEIEGSGIWNDNDNNVLPSIKLSFKYLPSVAMKKCFVYCAIFREDEEIEKDRLIQLWMAQGFLQHPHDEMERVGEEYFDVLLNNSLFQDAEFDDLGNVISCKMHDAVHALARDLSKNDVAQRVQHLSLLDDNQQGLTSKLSDALHTLFLCFNPTMLENLSMKRVKCLRALSLVGIGLEELPNSIGELKHLRYLDISTNRIQSLPDGFVKLYNLQTLRVIHSVPMFPKGLNKLVNLRHIVGEQFDTMGIPVGLGTLTCLQTLPTTIGASLDRGGNLSELQTLCKLKGSLTIDGLQYVEVEEAQKVELGLKENIKVLTLSSSSSFSTTPTSDDFLEKEKMVVQALQPHPNLTSLTIENYQGKALPQWVLEMTGFGIGSSPPLSNLVCFEIRYCYSLERLPSLKNLVALKELELNLCTNAISFPNHLECLISLQRLDVCSCGQMENIAADITPLVSLQMVRIRDCRNMTCLPSGISNLPSLETLVIGEFSQDLDVFPFPEADTYDYDNDVLSNANNLNGNGCGHQLLALLECCNSFSRTNHIGKRCDNELDRKRTTMTVRRYFESLVYLRLFGNGMDKVKSLPNPIRYLHQLRHLGICCFSGLEALPEWLGNLTSLRELELYDLPKIKYLPSQAAIEHLTELDIVECPLLTKACARETGTEWAKIKLIPNVTID